MEEKCIYRSFYATERICGKATAPFIIGEGSPTHKLSDDEYISMAVRFSESKKISLCIWEKEDCFQLDYCFSSVVIKKEHIESFAQLILESDKFAFQTQGTALPKTIVSFVRDKRAQ